MKYGFLVVSLLIGFLASGQAVNDESKALMEEVSKIYKNAKDLSADFTMILRNKQADYKDDDGKVVEFREEQSGKVYFSGDMFRLDLGAQEIYCDNENIWSFLKESDEVTITKYNEEDMEINPSELFTMYNNGFLYGLEGKDEFNNKDYQVVKLTPNDKSQSYHLVRLYINPGSKKIEGARVYEGNGNVYTYIIDNQELNKGLSESFFRFQPSKHPGVEVIDLR